MTTGGPDTSDVYEEELSRDGTKYLYDGEWKDLDRQAIQLQVRSPRGLEKAEKEIVRTHHGPVVKSVGQRAYAFKISLGDQIHLIDQMRLMNKARNLGEFLEAVSMFQLMPQNLMCGDVRGNIYYQRTGRVPRRPEGWDWTRPVPGNTSATEWDGFHQMSELVQILNPPAGFMQNCNISPGTMTFDSPMTADRYLPYIYNTSTDSSNPRGRRFLEIMREKGTVDREEAMAMVLDVKLHGTDEMRAKLARSFSRHAKEYPHLEEAARMLEKCEGHGRQDRDGQDQQAPETLGTKPARPPRCSSHSV
jgi:acyl-homoserine lactone acylase PvdQ